MIPGKIQGELPVSSAPVPDFVPNYRVLDGQASVSVSEDGSSLEATPLHQQRVTFRVPFRSRMVELKMAFGRKGTTGFGVLYLTDGAGRPDSSFGPGQPVDFHCEVSVSDST